MNGTQLPLPLLAMVAAAGVFTYLTPGERMKANAEPPAAKTIAKEYQGYWKIVGLKENQLPAAYQNYRLEIAERPDACMLYTDKGISRGIMAKGASLESDGKQPVIRYQYKAAWSVAVTLQPADKGRMKAKLVVTQEGKEVFNADVVLVETKPAT